MKKLLSIVLCVALLLSMFTAIPVVAVEGEEVAVSTALGDYYKFTFGEDGDQYDYTVANKTIGDTAGQATFKENTFYPLVIDNADASKGSADYKTITTPNGETYDVLEVKLSNNGYFVPLTKDGTPFEMVPGVKYNVNVKFFNPVCNTWGHLMVAAGGLNDKVADYSKKVNGVTWSNGEATAKNNVSVGAPFRQAGGNGIVSGNSYAAFLKEGSYGTANIAVSCICAQYSTEENPIECTHSSRYVTPYKEVSDILGIPEANGVYNEENNSYSTKYSYVDETPDDASDDVYVEGNNYLAFSLSGGKVSTNKTYPIYSNATAEEIAAAGEESTWQIVSIEIASENFTSSLSYSVNGEIIKTVEGDVDTPLEAVVPTVPEGKYFVGWFNDEAYTDVFTGTALEYGVKTVYARFADYGTYAKNDYEDGSMPATAVMSYAGGAYYPLLGYSYKGNSYDSMLNKGELKAHLERAGLSTEFPASAIAFYSDRTWGMPGCATFYNADGTLFVPKAGDTYKVTYKYMAPVHNGKEMAINIGYGISIAHANQTSTKDLGVTKAILAYNTITEPVTEWTTVSEFITVPEASDSYVPAIALQINGAAKKAVYEEDGETLKYYDYSAVLLDYIEIERVPVGKVTFMNADGSENSVVPVAVGEEIPYPVLEASLNTDNVWSASATEYVAPPKTVEKEEEITVYAYENPVISYENYPVYSEANVALHGGAIAYEDEMNAVVSDNEAYSGEKSMRLRNYGFHWVITEAHYNTAVTAGAYKYDAETDSFVKLDEVPEFVPATAETIADGTAIAFKRVSGETGMNVIRDFGVVESLTFDYKITFKYKATANNTTESTLSARIFPKANIWWGSAALVGSFTFPAGATDGWVTGEMYVRAENAYGGNVAKAAQVLDLKFNGNAEAFTNEIYIDDITIEEIEGLGTVTYVNGETTTNNVYMSGDEISYPTLPSDRQGDMVWSLSADEYVAAPKTFSEDITVYAILSDVIGFESYCGDKVDYIKNCLNVSVSEDVAFSGNKSLKYENNGYTYLSQEPATWATDWTKYYEFNEDGEIVALGGEEAPVWKERTYLEKRGNSNESSIALWSAPGGKAYKVSFKYFVPVELGVNVTLTPYTNGTNLWSPEGGVTYKESAYVIGTDTVAGEWLDGEFYFVSGATIKGSDLLYVRVAADVNFTNELVYFDDFTLTEVQSASFIIPEDATYEDGGILKDGVVTVFAEMDEEIVAPLVIDAEGNPVEIWADENGKRVTEFVNGGTYTVAPAFIYGDCDDSGEIDTGDLAALKLFLAGLGEVGLGADCDASGEVDTGDLAALKLFLAGMGNLGPAV